MAKKLLCLLLSVAVFLCIGGCATQVHFTDELDGITTTRRITRTEISVSGDDDFLNYYLDNTTTTTRAATSAKAIKTIAVGEEVQVSSQNPDGSGDVKISVIGFKKTDWKERNYRHWKMYDEPRGQLQSAQYASMLETEEVGMLLLGIENISYDPGKDRTHTMWLEDILQTHDQYDLALTAMKNTYDYSSYEVAGGETVEIEIGEKTRVAVPYIYDTSNEELTVILGNEYKVIVDVEQ